MRPTLLLAALLLVGCDEVYDYATDVLGRPDPHALLDCDFDDVGDAWEQVDCSPVLAANQRAAGEWERGSIGTFDVEQVEVFGAPFFQMWYSGAADGAVGHDIGTAASWNGVDWTRHPWNPVLRRGPTQAFDRDDASVACVAYDSQLAIFHLWYEGSNGTGGSGTSLGHATSTDGVFWTRDLQNPINPLFDSGSRLSRVSSCDAVYSESGLHLWASGLRIPPGQFSTPAEAVERAQYVIAHLRTEDGTFFDVTRELVLEPRVPEAESENPHPLQDAFDAQGVLRPTVFAYGDPDEPRWWMLYAGYEDMVVEQNPVGPGVIAAPVASRIGLATSDEAEAGWERWTTVPLPLDFSGEDRADSPRASYLNGRLYTFFSDAMPDPIDGRLIPGIGLAISPFPPVQEGAP
jgi:hypothetical protein